ncbi:endonuclease domain-containing protein [Streptomyces parvus]|uniref:endonuclease domain-containing protein n=1 Tax=Streptomyces parvus TaxID=66428 RepID=UPI00332D013A
MSEVVFRSKDQNRHHPQGKLCHHFHEHRLTCDEYDRLKERAAGCCEICGTPEAETGGRRLVVDHFEGRLFRLVRGLLCDRCNSVMSCIDGTKRWGANRRWEARARQYEAASWHQPTSGQRALIVAQQAAQSARVYRR